MTEKNLKFLISICFFSRFKQCNFCASWSTTRRTQRSPLLRGRLSRNSIWRIRPRHLSGRFVPDFRQRHVQPGTLSGLCFNGENQKWQKIYVNVYCKNAKVWFHLLNFYMCPQVQRVVSGDVQFVQYHYKGGSGGPPLGPQISSGPPGHGPHLNSPDSGIGDNALNQGKLLSWDSTVISVIRVSNMFRFLKGI
jgi:hypothetical protein